MPSSYKSSRAVVSYVGTIYQIHLITINDKKTKEPANLNIKDLNHYLENGVEARIYQFEDYIDSDGNEIKDT